MQGHVQGRQQEGQSRRGSGHLQHSRMKKVVQKVLHQAVQAAQAAQAHQAAVHHQEVHQAAQAAIVQVQEVHQAAQAAAIAQVQEVQAQLQIMEAAQVNR